MSYWIFALGPSKICGFTTKRRVVIKILLAPRNIILPWWEPKHEHMLQYVNMVHFHFLLSLGPISCKIGFQQPYIFKVAALGLCVKRPWVEIMTSFTTTTTPFVVFSVMYTICKGPKPDVKMSSEFQSVTSDNCQLESTKVIFLK